MNLSKKLTLTSLVFKKNLYPLLPKIFKMIQVKKAEKGTILIREGDVCNHLFFLEKGLMRNFEEHNGKEFTLWFFTEGEFVTSMYSLYNSVPSKQYIEVLEDSEYYKIDKSVFFEVIRMSNDIALYAVDEIMNQYSDYLYNTRLLRFKNAEEKFLQLKDNKPNLINRLTQKHLASYLSIDHTYLSKIMAKYANEIKV
jgi:CRP-like cAMP-binding protein